MNLDVIHYLIDAIVGIGVIAVGIPYIKGQYGKESNQLLRDLVNDQKTAIENLEKWQKEATSKISALEIQVKVITAKRTDLAEIIEKSLDTFFEAHPELAIDTRTKLNAQNV